MSKLSVVLYYWIFVIAGLLIAKFAGFAENNAAIFKVLIVITILYIGIMTVYSTSKKAQEKAKQIHKSKNQQNNRNLSKSSHSSHSKKKKK